MKNINYSNSIFTICAACAVFFAANIQISAQKKYVKMPVPCVVLYTIPDKPNYVGQEWANLDSPLCRQAIGNLRAASLFALGINLDVKPDYEDDDTFKTSVDYRLQEWLLTIGSSAIYKARFDDGLTIRNATDFLVETELIKNYGDVGRSNLVQTIFDDIYGRKATAAESDFYTAQIKAGKIWYSLIFLAEKNKLNQNPPLREKLIDQTYQYAFGRPAKPDEAAYWKPRQEAYREMIEADRVYLYAPQNIDILREIVTRRFTNKRTGTPPAAGTVEKKIKDFSRARLVYQEMQ